MKMIYDVEDKPKFGRRIIFALQQLLAIIAATIAVPAVVNAVCGTNMSTSAALFGAGVGTLVYQLFTKRKSPVFLGSSFSFLPSMYVAFLGAATMQLGYLGIVMGALFAGLVYVLIALIVKLVGVKWINKIMPAIVIGPTVSIIGLSLAGNAVSDLQKGCVYDAAGNMTASPYACIICGLITLFTVMLCSVYGKRAGKLIPFVIGIIVGYAAAAAMTVYGIKNGMPELQIIDFSGITGLYSDGITFASFISLPQFTFIEAFKGISDLNVAYIVTIAVAYVPVAFVVFAEHIADHKNLSSIIERDLLEKPGLSRTLLGDGIGSMAGAFFGGCPNTTYGESIACVAITKNASVVTITLASVLAILFSFISPFVQALASIPNCVMGGVCIALYGFISVSGLKMLQDVDLNENKNLFVVSVILIAGIGGFALTFGEVTITSTACALILGIIANLLVKNGKTEEETEAIAAAKAEKKAAKKSKKSKVEVVEETTEEVAEEAAEVAEETTEEIAEEAAEVVAE